MLLTEAQTRAEAIAADADLEATAQRRRPRRTWRRHAVRRIGFWRRPASVPRHWWRRPARRSPT
ncbi:hypothetical protein LT493_26080 [Streptomyces tricolor]|nr:hypothetical protein [Streptomyces tricolor]